ALHHSEETARQAGFLEQRARLLQDDRRELARLHHHRVSRHQRGCRVADGDRERIVPGGDDPDHAARIEPQVGLLVGEEVQGDLLVAEALPGVIRVPVHRIGDRQHLHEQRLVPRLAVLPRQVIAEIRGPFEQQVLEAKQHGTAGGDRLLRPLRLRDAGLLDRLPDLLRSRDAHLAQELAAAGLVHRQRALLRHRALRGFLRDRDCFRHVRPPRGASGVRRLPRGVNPFGPCRNSELTSAACKAKLGFGQMLGIDDMLRLGNQPLDTPAELSPVENDAASTQPPTVLVVDDDRAVREVLSAVLKEEGYPVRQAASADAALQMLRGDDLPLLLCDVKMPEHDGLWLLDHVLQRHPHAAVVMLTGFGDTESAVDCLKRGAADYLLKPPRVTELVRAIERAWSKSRLTSARARYHQGLARRGRERTAELTTALGGIALSYSNTLVALVNALDAREHETSDHSQRVVRYTLAIARRMGIRDAQLEH